MIESMLLATDGSETAADAVSQAGDLAAGTGAKVHVMTAYQPLHARVATGKTVDPERGQWQLAQDSWADTVLDDACAVLRLRGVEAQPHARKGDPADAIIELAEELGIDLIVVGNKGLTGARRFLLGSVPDKVSHHAPCSVLIVHTT
jgi:nucleotide-binding universal stress UspA family protein